MKKFFNAAIKNSVSISVISLFLTFLVWWIWLHYFVPSASGDILLIWAGVYPLVALYGAIFGFIASSRWGGVRSFIGRAIVAFSLGLLWQFFGQLIYVYYAYHLNIDIVYPSLSDIGFFGSALFYTYGALMLAKVPGVKLSFKLIGGKIYAVIIPLILLILTNYIFLQGYAFDWSNPIKTFLDFGYSLVESVFIAFALLAFSLSKEKLLGALKIPILSFILALVFQYLTDFVFTYQANTGAYLIGGINDLMYAISYILMAFSLILLSLWPSLVRD